MKIVCLLVLGIIGNFSVGAQERIDEIPSKVVGEAYGDLDHDGIPEKIVVLDTGLEGDFGTERYLLIYKKFKEKWTLWHSSQGAVLDSAHGGMMGDPFEGIEISNGRIVIRHAGGSRQQWNYTHSYQLENGVWKLMAATINYVVPCEGILNFDYNLSSGKVLYQELKDVCPAENVDTDWKDTKKEVSLNPIELPNMDGFYPGSNKVESKDIGKDVYY